MIRIMNNEGIKAVLVNACNSLSVMEVTDRFEKTLEILDAGTFLGAELKRDQNGKAVLHFFTSDCMIDKYDFGWMLTEEAEVTEVGWNEGEFFRTGKKIWILTPDEDGTDIIKPVRTDDVTELLETDAVFRLLSEGGKKKNSVILMSTDQEMSKALRAQLNRAFGPLVIHEWKDQEEVEQGKGLASPLSALMRSYANYQSPKRNKEKEIARDTSLYVVGMSIRTMNTLMRNGIRTAGDLADLSIAELASIRNLGTKGMEEALTFAKRVRKEEKKIAAAAEKKEETTLDDLTGLEEVKKQVRRYAAFAEMKSRMKAAGEREVPVSLHMAFLGNPGTGKTTVARRIAGILADQGLIRERELLEVSRADLVAGYIGQTAQKVKSVFEKAEGKVLFIDEAYSLVDARKGLYGDEAITAIVQEMENRRENTVVIFAGYPKEMEEFLNQNPGLKSRVPFCFRFADYNENQLIEILVKEAQKYGFTLSAEALRTAERCCIAEMEKKNPGNGRFSRNLLQKAVLAYAERTSGTETDDFILRTEDFMEEFSAGTAVCTGVMN